MTADEIAKRVTDKFSSGVEHLVFEPDTYKTEPGVPYFKVEAAQLVELATFLRDDADLHFDYLNSMTAVDFLPPKPRKPKPDEEVKLEPGSLMLVYQLYSMDKRHHARMKVEGLPRAGAKVPTVSGLWPTADWHERECYDLFGIKFDGHPDMRRILLPEDWEGHPLLRDYDPKIIQNRWQRMNLGPDVEDMGPDSPVDDPSPIKATS